MSTYADEVFETQSEAAFKQLDESELTGSALDKNELERTHLMLYIFSQYYFYAHINLSWEYCISIIMP